MISRSGNPTARQLGSPTEFTHTDPHVMIGEPRAEKPSGVVATEMPPPRRSPFVNGYRADQNPPTPFGVPRPVGPSQPTRAWHSWVGEHEPLEPVVTSKKVLAEWWV